MKNKVREVTHDVTWVRKVRRRALRAQAWFDRDYSNRTRKAKTPDGFITGHTLYQVYLKEDRPPMYYVTQRMNLRKRNRHETVSASNKGA